MGLNYWRLRIKEFVNIDCFSQVLLRWEWSWRESTSSVLWFVIMFLVFKMENVKFFFSLFKLAFKSGYLFLVWLFILFQLNLKESQFLHCFLDSLFILAQHTICRSILRLESFIDILKFNYFFLEILKFSFEVISLSFDKVKLFLKDWSLIFFLLLKIKLMNTLKVSI